MRKCLSVFGTACCLICCGPSAAPKSASDQSAGESAAASGSSSKKQRSEMSHWSSVEPTESTGPGTDIAKRKAQVVVTSNPDKHGESLHFRFTVNTTPISGVFSAPGGQTTTFVIPAGTVYFTVDECENDTQGFELQPDESMPISCELTTEGDCCWVAIPDDDKPKAKKQRRKK
jgi:hypothetical protein